MGHMAPLCSRMGAAAGGRAGKSAAGKDVRFRAGARFSGQGTGGVFIPQTSPILLV